MASKAAEGKKEKPFPCPKCEKRLSSRSNLSVHCLSIHQRSLEKNAPASPAAIGAQKKRAAEKRLRTQQKMSTAGAESQKQVREDLALSDSDVSVSLTISDEDIEPNDVDEGKTPISKTISPLYR